MVRKAETAVALLTVMFMGTVGQARVCSPRVVSPHNADAYSMKTFGEFHRWCDLKGDARAWEVYKYLADTRTGVFHMNEVLEGNDTLSEYKTIRDPVKIINVYGYGYCYIFGPVMAGVCEGIGLGRARTLTLPDWSHVVAECYYDDKWHYLDIDVRAVFRRPDGTLASMAEAKRDDALWKGPTTPLFFPKDNLEQVRKIYANTPVLHYHNFHYSGHTMDYVLRQGETFTRWWKPQGDRWHHSPEWNKSEWLVKLIESEPCGPKPNHPQFTNHTHGNGRFVYKPNLTNRSTDFADGVFDSSNVEPGSKGLTLAKAGNGFAIFEVHSPYIIVPKVGDIKTTEDDSEASVVQIDASGARISLSKDNGLTWEPLGMAEGKRTLDLTEYAAGTYGYLLKIELEGQPGDAVVRDLSIETWVQVAPASLPSLRRGTNRMELRAGDHYGLQSRVVEVHSNASDRDDFMKHVVEPPEDYDPPRKTQRIRGSFVAKIDALPGTEIAWFSAGANFRTHQRDAAKNTRNNIAYAIDQPDSFQEIYRADVPTDTQHWHCNADREVRLERPAKAVFVKYTGDPAVNNYRIYAHCVEKEPRRESAVTVRHVWIENGERKHHKEGVGAGGSYAIECGGDPEDESIEFSVESGAIGKKRESISINQRGN